MLAAVSRWHRRLSLLAGVALLLWAASGLLHPLMSWTNPRAAAFAPPPGEPLALPAQAPSALLEAEPAGIVRLLSQGGQSLWQIASPDRQHLRYVDADTGEPVPEADRVRAVQLARHYTGLQSASLSEVRHITQYDREYPAVNRLLPVWRVEFADERGLTAYVHTGEDRLASLTDRRKRVLLTLFQTVHTLDFLEGVEGLRLGLILAAVGSVLAMAMLGIGMLLGRRARPGAPAMRRRHRLLAWAAWVPVLMFSVSGLFHLLRLSPLLQPVPASISPTVQGPLAWPAELEGARALTLLPLAEDRAVWRARFGPQSLALYDARSGERLAGGDAELAQWLASTPPVSSATRQAGFSPEYGFANKRLPVWRVEQPQGLAFVDTAFGQVAARVGALDVAEQWTFSSLHKWQLLDFLGKAWRDAVLSAGALLGMLAALFGLALRRRR
ncbi:PepSY domain-containing protein [Solimonas sp. SE-A11]|uniref:PepSY domain-containing protein n=1 Tax=Solimonas sp. SE-A11 TaxID=3054954 RepID=UPI00259CBD29|nr:PepSY domain-containing protein [Solimonas sp. SE-A11]MDM4771121.1 PepSY domain-containing protein [Solimonas sp. SE-A11]